MICNECKIQLSYPPTKVNTLTKKKEFYYITSGTPFNLSFIDGSDNLFVSGLATKGVINKKNLTQGNAELTIAHKTSNNMDFYLVIPLQIDPKASTSLSSYLESDKETILDIGSEIGASNITYSKTTKPVFIVNSPIKVKSIPSDLPDGILTINQNNNKQIKNATIINDEIVCDYEGDEADSNKSVSTKNNDWTAAIVMMLGIIALGVTYVGFTSITDENIKKIVYGTFLVISLVSGITLSIYAGKSENEKRFSGFAAGSMISWMMFLMVAWFIIKLLKPF